VQHKRRKIFICDHIDAVLNLILASDYTGLHFSFSSVAETATRVRVYTNHNLPPHTFQSG